MRWLDDAVDGGFVESAGEKVQHVPSVDELSFYGEKSWGERMKRTDQRIVNVSYPTPFSVWGKDLQTTDGLAPENCHAANVWDDTYYRVVVLCWEYGIPYRCGPLSRRYLTFLLLRLSACS